MTAGVPDLTGAGTPEDEWRNWPGMAALPEMAQPDVTCRPWSDDVLVVAPHPDDEVLGIGGTLRLLAEGGARIRLLAITDGEHSHPGSRTLSPRALAERRPREVRSALDILGLESVTIERLGLPDGEVAGHIHVVAEAVRDRLKPGSLCLSTWHRDGHPDHDAVGRAARAGATDCGGCTVVEYPLWMWHWARPDDSDVPWQSLRRVQLPESVVAAKRAAAETFTTQVQALSSSPEDAAVLPPEVLRRWLRDFEVVLA